MTNKHFTFILSLVAFILSLAAFVTAFIVPAIAGNMSEQLSTDELAR